MGGRGLVLVLSGFLITGILYESRYSPTYFRDFYIRRCLRILPLYWGLLTLLWLFAFWQKIPHLLFPDYVFIQNFFFRWVGMGKMPVGPTALEWRYGTVGLGVFWSLCVEEQFYFLWPCIVRRFPTRVSLLRISLLGAVLVLALRCFLFFADKAAAQKSMYLYMLPFTRFDGLLIGAALNLWLQERRLTRQAVRRYSTATSFAGSGLLCCAFAVFGGWNDFQGPVTQIVSSTLFAIAFAGVILRSLDDTSCLSHLLRWKPLVALGAVSYGFYLFHDLFAASFARLVSHCTEPERPLAVLAYFLLFYAIARFSFRFWESPFLSLKDRLAPSHKSIPKSHW